MFRKSSKTAQLKIFTSPKSLFSGKSLSLYEDGAAWHNQFHQQVTMRIDENIFRPLYCDDNGTPNFPIRMFYKQMEQSGTLPKATKDRLTQLLKMDGNKVLNKTYSRWVLFGF